MQYSEVLDKAREVLAPMCKVCPDCNGVACKGKIPGVGGIGNGTSFIEAREFIKSIRINMDAVHENYEIDPSIELFGKTFKYPFFVAPIGGMPFNYTNYLTEEEYCQMTVEGALEEGIFAFTGDGPNDAYFPSTLPAIKAANGVAVSTIKPWDREKCLSRIADLNETGCMAFAMDIDATALVNLKLMGKPVYPQSVDQLAEYVDAASMPFIVKGIMTAKSALKCVEAGAYGIVISNHGGRIMQDFGVPAAMIQEIRDAVGDSLKIFVDGGIRTGADVFKCLALGADAVLIGRPYATAAHGGGKEGVKLLTQKLAAELTETMLMTDCRTLADITMEKISL